MAGIYYTDPSGALVAFPGVVMKATPEGSTEFSSKPVEDSTTVTDHATVMPDTLSVETRISPVVLSGTPGDAPAAMGLLQQLQMDRTLFTISLDVNTWESMGLAHWSAPRTVAEGPMLALTLDFVLVRIVSTQDVGAPPLAPTRRRTHSGTTPTAPVDSATLAALTSHQTLAVTILQGLGVMGPR